MSVMSDFYERFPYPIRPSGYARPADSQFWVKALNHEARRLSPCSFKRILVVGCGTGQAVTTALMFPDSEVTGIDISKEAFRCSQEDAVSTGLGNKLQLVQTDLLEASGTFDAIFCDGVIHHLADPMDGVRKLASLLLHDGLIHLMVYNRHYTQKYVDFADGLRLLLGTTGRPNFEKEKVAAELLLGRAFGPEDADIYIHPVKHTFTVDTLDVVLSRAELKLLAPTAEANASGRWEMTLDNGELLELCNALSQVDQWRVRERLAPPPLLSFWVGHESQEVVRRPPINMKTSLTLFARLADGSFSCGEGTEFNWRAEG